MSWEAELSLMNEEIIRRASDTTKRVTKTEKGLTILENTLILDHNLHFIATLFTYIILFEFKYEKLDNDLIH